MTKSRVGRDRAYFLEVVQTLQNLSGKIESDLKELSGATTDVRKVFEDLQEQARDFSPQIKRDGLNTIDPNDERVQDPREMLDELRGRVRFALRSLDETARLLPDRRGAIATLIGAE